MIIAVGSTNRAKVKAVRNAVEMVWPHAELAPVAAPSGVSEMPMSAAEGQQGAIERARKALAMMPGAELGIGMEGAAQEDNGVLYLTNWVAVVDLQGRQSLANGGSLPLPESIACELRAGGELGPIMDRLTGQHDTKHGLGAAGILTQGIVPRELTFRVGVGLALAPFVRPDLYSDAQA
ncbi:MAG: DUF84 family protein [Chloroflexi bacterium]|jgi:inosine/xanthosine triphosphatase|nr:DUF84 family protein [Chloroflexota bacterium]